MIFLEVPVQLRGLLKSCNSVISEKEDSKHLARVIQLWPN